MYMWDCQREMWVFIVLFWIRFFSFPTLKHLTDHLAIFIFFQDWTWCPLSCPLVGYMGFLSKLCWWWPIYLAVGDSGKMQMIMGLNAVLKHKHLPWGLLMRAVGWSGCFFLLNGPLTSLLGLHGAQPLAASEGEGLGWWVGLSVYPLQRKVVARCSCVTVSAR